MRKFAKRWLPVIVWMAVIFSGSSIGNVPRVGDKATDGLVHRAAHVLEYAVLGALLLRALSKGQAATRREMLAALIIAAAYGVSDEIHQRFTPGRSSEGASVVFDVVGGLIGAWLWRWWSMRRANRPPERDTLRPPENRNEAAADRVFD